jgi:preprotein translocase subunit SecD
MKIIALCLAISLLVLGCSRKPADSAPPAVTPQFTLAAGDLATPAIVNTNGFGTLNVIIQLSGGKADEFRQFTQAHVNQQVRIMFGSQVLSKPVIRDPIINGVVEESFAPSEASQAWATADLLNRH